MVRSVGRADLSAYALKSDLPVSARLPGEFTVDALPTPTADNLGKYAWVTDLFGSKSDLVLCAKIAGSTVRYFWQPVRPVFRADMTVTGSMTLDSLKVPSVLRATGTIGTGVTRDLTLGPGTFPGQSQRVKRVAGGLGTLRVVPQILTGGVLNLGTPVSILLNATSEFIWDFDSGWEQWT